MHSTPFLQVWQYQVRAEVEAEFVRHYGPDGAWARLFRRVPGYLGTELLHDVDEPVRYVTVDRWADRAAFDAFIAQLRDEYEKLDRECARLTVAEAHLGAFHPV